MFMTTRRWIAARMRSGGPKSLVCLPALRLFCVGGPLSGRRTARPSTLTPEP